MARSFFWDDEMLQNEVIVMVMQLNVVEITGFYST